MSQESGLGYVEKPAKRVPVLYDVDVVVAGSGLCSTFVAIAAGRYGARTLVIDRFGSVGGNIGPGMLIGGGLCIRPEVVLPGGMTGIGKELVERVEELRVKTGRRNTQYPEISNLVSWVATDMMRNAGVELLLDAYVADPIVDGNVVRGVYVECKAGLVAVKAKVTVDGTGEADIARRAGAPIIHYLEPTKYHDGKINSPYMFKRYPKYYNDSGLCVLFGSVNWEKYQAFVEQDAVLSEEEAAWVEEWPTLKDHPKSMIPILYRGDKSGEFKLVNEFQPNVNVRMGKRDMYYGSGVVGYRIACGGAVDATAPKLISSFEIAIRDFSMRMVRFYRTNVPGFEQAYVLAVSPFLGWRGGPHVEGEHTLTIEEEWTGRKCEDVLYRNIHAEQEADPSGFDVPYGITLPKGIDGLLMCGRGAAYQRRGHDPGSMRARPSMMIFGQCVGTAAAMSALDGVFPRTLDIKKLQRRLNADGIVLGDDARLAELALNG